METTVKLYSLSLREIKTYLFASIFIVGNIALPQLCHYIGGGLIWLPIYFFTLIATYKYGISVGLLTAILSPLVNSMFFGMPPIASLPVIMAKSVLLASIGAYVAYKMGKISFLGVVITVFAYQFIGTAIEWIIVMDFFKAIQDFRIGIPGILAQIFGGYFILKAIAKL